MAGSVCSSCADRIVCGSKSWPDSSCLRFSLPLLAWDVPMFITAVGQRKTHHQKCGRARMCWRGLRDWPQRGETRRVQWMSLRPPWPDGEDEGGEGKAE